MVITMIEATLKWDFNDITPQLDKLYNTTADLESCAFYLRQMPIPRRNDPSGLRRHRRIEATNYYRSTMDCSTKFPAVIAFTTKASTSDSHQGMNNARETFGAHSLLGLAVAKPRRRPMTDHNLLGIPFRVERKKRSIKEHKAIKS